MTVLVFRTNMICDGCKQTVGAALTAFGPTLRWSADLDDCDKILRVETDSVPAEAVARVVRQAGFVCEELV